MMKTPIAKTLLRSLIILFVAVSCTAQKGSTTGSIPAKGQLAQQNVDAAIWYATSAENFYIYHQTYNYATTLLIEKLKFAKGGMPAAVVVDIDETVLDNSAYMLQLIQQNESFADESWERWVKKADAKLLPGAAEFLRFCEENGVLVYYVSNRSQSQLNATIENLMKYNLPNTTPEHVLLKGDESDKTSRRQTIARQANVLLYLGDNLRDFDEMYKDRSNGYGKQIVKNGIKEMLPMFILFPNPMYGQWQSIFTFPPEATEFEKARLKMEQAQPEEY